jgi:hypothetical protein
VIETQRLETDADLPAAMRVSIERLEGEGWTIEAPPRFGFLASSIAKASAGY